MYNISAEILCEICFCKKNKEKNIGFSRNVGNKDKNMENFCVFVIFSLKRC